MILTDIEWASYSTPFELTDSSLCWFFGHDVVVLCISNVLSRLFCVSLTKKATAW